MYDGITVIDADAHKLENPITFLDYLDPNYRNRVRLIADNLGDQRVQMTDRNPKTGQLDFQRVFPQSQGLGKGGFRNLHPQTTLGAIFNQRRIEHMDAEGVDLHVLFGTLNLTFSCLIDKDLSIAELFQYLSAAFDKSPRLFSISPKLLEWGASLLGRREVYQRLCGNLQVDISKTKETLNWSPSTNIERGLRKTVEWYREQQRQR